ncbi:MAG: molybdenum cofactor guanylyltransferase [Pirellulaceae bacterium]|nr:molybdenum cofactor guanylyltransferase [Pirellulaceae bacterium]
MQTGGMILCGGRSSRMGLPKLTLPFGPELMLQRVVRILREVVEPIVVVRAADQDLPPLPSEVIITEDRRASRGPLEGMQAGLWAVRGIVESVYATGCDAPLLRPEFVQTMIDLKGEYEIAVPVKGEFHFPLAAVYSIGLTETIEKQLDADQLRPRFLFDLVNTLRVPCDELEKVDDGLESLQNLNRVEDYFAALARAGFDAPPEIHRQMTDCSTDD